MNLQLGTDNSLFLHISLSLSPNMRILISLLGVSNEVVLMFADNLHIKEKPPATLNSKWLAFIYPQFSHVVTSSGGFKLSEFIPKLVSHALL